MVGAQEITSPNVRVRVPAGWLAVKPRNDDDVQRVAGICGEGVEALKSLRYLSDSTTRTSFVTDVAAELTRLGQDGVIYCMLRKGETVHRDPDNVISVVMELAVRSVEGLDGVPAAALEEVLLEDLSRSEDAGTIDSSEITSEAGRPIFRRSWNRERPMPETQNGLSRIVQYVQPVGEYSAVIVSTFSVLSSTGGSEIDEELDAIASSLSLMP